MNRFDFTSEITEENITAAIQFLQANENEDAVVFYIDSPGGSVLDGLRLFRAMDNFKGQIIAEVGVMAASMAAFIALNCDKVRITKDTFMLLHSAWATACGTAEELRSTADLLEQASNRLSEIVTLRAKDSDAVAGYMSKDSWFGWQAILENFDDIELVEENRFNKAIAASYALLKADKPLELAAMLKAEEKEDEEPEEEEKQEEPEKEEEPDEEEKEEPKAKVDNTFAMSVLAKAEKYI